MTRVIERVGNGTSWPWVFSKKVGGIYERELSRLLHKGREEYQATDLGIHARNAACYLFSPVEVSLSLLHCGPASRRKMPGRRGK